MGGYKLGFILAGIVIAIFIAVFVFALLPSHLPPPTDKTLTAGFMDAIAIKSNLNSLKPEQIGSGAGFTYIKAYQKMCDLAPSLRAIRGISRDPNPENNRDFMAIVSLLQQAAGKTVNRRHLLFIKQAPLPSVQDLVQMRLEAMGTATIMVGENDKLQSHFKQALKAYQAALMLGYNEWKYGLFLDVRTAGLDTLSSAVDAIRSYYGHGKTKSEFPHDAANNLHNSLKNTVQTWYKKYAIVHSTDPYAGDMANIIKHDQDITWRIEAMINLGIARWSTSDASEAKAILKFLQKWQHNPNAYLSAAAKRSANITRADIRAMGVSSE
ncbi:MAG: hypothetical protein HKL96_04870 [Phycisphaerales bacterium]|nr:hypothetical protein [Phycisphaerales bacterium]